MNIQDFLREHDTSFEVIRHRPTYDAQRMAHAVHVSGTEVAKTVLLRANSGYVYLVVVLPATKQVDLDKVQFVMGGSKLELATEQEIGEHCPDRDSATTTDSLTFPSADQRQLPRLADACPERVIE